MEKLHPRYIEIIKVMNSVEKYWTQDELALKLEVSSKTISRTIHQYENDDVFIQQYGFKIDRKYGKGYSLDIMIPDKFEKLVGKKLPLNTESNFDYDKTERAHEIIKILLVKDDYIQLPDIADILYVSEASIANDLKLVRHLLRQYGLEIIGQSGKGIRLSGTELSIRLCYATYFFDNREKDYSLISQNKSDFRYIEDLVFKIFEQYDIQISELNRWHLIVHIYVAMIRINRGYIIEFDDKDEYEIKNEKEYQVAKELTEHLGNHFNMTLIENEIIYFAIQISGKKTMREVQKISHINQDIQYLILETFNEIKQKFDIDLTEDNETYEYLMLHFEPMLTRLKYGIRSNNPLIDEVKLKHPMSFDMGIIAKKIIKKHQNYELDDNEVGYLAMYFSLALDKLKYRQRPKNILLICSLGASSSIFLKHQLIEKFGQYLNDIIVCEFHELREIPTQKFDGIISTVHHPIATAQPVIYIENILTKNNMEELQAFFQNNELKRFEIDEYLDPQQFLSVETFESIETALEYITGTLPMQHAERESLIEKILEREELSSTAFGNLCSIPHPVKMVTEETFFVPVVLNKPMRWNKSKVKYIFLLSPSKNNPSDLRRFNEMLTRFIGNEEKIAKFNSKPTFEVLREILIDMN